MRRMVIRLAGAALWLLTRTSFGAAPIRVMILDGESGGPYHRWPQVTAVLKKQLDETGLFNVDVVTAPPAGSSFTTFQPDLARYQAVVLNYDAPDDRWPADLKAAFEQYMRNGGGLVIVHAADNAFPAWQAFNDMIGVGGWRDRTEAAGPFCISRTASSCPTPRPGAPEATGRLVRDDRRAIRIIRLPRACRAGGCTRATNSMRRCAARDAT